MPSRKAMNRDMDKAVLLKKAWEGKGREGEHDFFLKSGMLVS